VAPPSRAEVERRLVHATGGIPAAAYALDAGLSYSGLRLLLTGAVAVALVLEAVRLGTDVEWIVFDRLTREYEQRGLAGYALYLLSMAGAAWLFPPEAAVPGMLALAFVDPVGGLLSTGELRTVKRPFVLLATFGLATLLCLGFVGAVPAVLGGVAATLADGVKPVVRGYVIDDNLTIPPAVAVAITAGLAVA